MRTAPREVTPSAGRFSAGADRAGAVHEVHTTSWSWWRLSRRSCGCWCPAGRGRARRFLHLIAPEAYRRGWPCRPPLSPPSFHSPGWTPGYGSWCPVRDRRSRCSACNGQAALVMVGLGDYDGLLSLQILGVDVNTTGERHSRNQQWAATSRKLVVASVTLGHGDGAVRLGFLGADHLTVPQMTKIAPARGCRSRPPSSACLDLELFSKIREMSCSPSQTKDCFTLDTSELSTKPSGGVISSAM